MAQFAPTLIQLNAATGVAYEEKAFIELQAGITYSVIELQTNLVDRKTLKRVSIDLNGSEICYASAEELHYIDQVLKKHTKDGRIVLDLARFEYRSLAGIRIKELVTFPTDKVTVFCEFGTKAAADPAKLTMKGKAWVHNNDSPRYFIPSMYRITHDVSADGEFEFFHQNAAPNRFVQRMSFDETNVNISKLVIYRGDLKIYEGTRDDVEFAMQRNSNNQRAVVAGRFVFEPTLLGFGTHGALNTGDSKTNRLKFVVTTDASGAMPILVEGYEQVQAIPQSA